MQRNMPVAHKSLMPVPNRQFSKYSRVKMADLEDYLTHPFYDVPDHILREMPRAIRYCHLLRRLDYWIETAIDGKWMAAFRLVANKRGQPVIGEMRIFPAEGKREPGRWSGEFYGVYSEVPADGITAKLIRKVR